MSKEKKSEPMTEEVPGWVKKAPELLPVWDWWVKEGRSTVTYLLVAAVCVAGWYAFKNWKASRAAAANTALVNAFTTDELEEAVAKFGGSSTGAALKMRLAKSYLDGERWEEAEKTYADYIAAAKPDDPFAALAQLGHAYALEGSGKVSEARQEYERLSAETNLPVHATAALGVARCMALGGDKDGALKKLEALDDPRAKNLAETVKRYDPSRKPVSLFDAANAAESTIAAEKKAVVQMPAAVTKPDAGQKAPKADAGQKAPQAAPAKSEPPAAGKK